ncbi:MAG: hypothetical protein ABWZ74_04180 [Hyphomicrobiaceae bacterium]|jgi:hypothetical protein
MTADSKTFITALGHALALVVSGASVMIGEAVAAGPSYDITNRLRIEQDIRRSYNNYNRNIPTNPAAPRSREQHLRDGTLVGPAGTSAASCSYQYGRWKRTGSKYWRERYFDCAG